MPIAELIKELQRILEKHGDIDIYIAPFDNPENKYFEIAKIKKITEHDVDFVDILFSKP